MDYKIGIVGYGYVGKGMHRMFGDWVVAIHDPFLPEEARKKLKGFDLFDIRELKGVDLAIVSVPTQMNEDGSCDTSLVIETVRMLANDCEVKNILIKSTIAPGTTDYLVKLFPLINLVFSPEYMGEGKYFTPSWKYPDPENPVSHGFAVLGGKQVACEKIANVLIRKMGPHTKFVFMPAKEAEMVKYWENIWGAMKVIFTNHMKDCIDALGGEFYRVREGWAADPRVERMHTAVFENARGFSGKCYPKDLRAFIHAVEQAGFDPKLLKMIWNLNCEYRPTEFKPIK